MGRRHERKRSGPAGGQKAENGGLGSQVTARDSWGALSLVRNSSCEEDAQKLQKLSVRERDRERERVIMGQNLAIHESRLRWLGRGEDNIEFTGQHLSSIRVNDLSILAMSFAMSVFT